MAADTRCSKSFFSKTESDVGLLSKDLTKFLKCDENASESFRQFSKSLFDHLKPEDKLTHLKQKRDLEELIIEDFDDEQIWQELEIRNQLLLEASMSSIPQIGAKAELDFGVDLGFDRADDDQINEDDLEEDDELDEEELENDADEESATENGAFSEEEVVESDRKSITLIKRTPVRKSIVDDDFFRLGNMEEFLEAEDKKEERKLRRQRKNSDSDNESDDDSVDLFADIPTDDDQAREAKYDDFFDPVDGVIVEDEENSQPGNKKNRKSVRFADETFGEEEEEPPPSKSGYDLRDAEDDDLEEDDTESSLKTAKDLFKNSDEESDDEQKLSSHERKQKKLMERIAKIENSRLDEKEWQMRGEVSSRNRPGNSLMEEHLDFEHQTRQAPQITRTLTQKLEDWIIQRIKDKAWDDVVLKVKPVEEVFEFRRRLTLDQQKSKVGLAEVYEQEFLKMKEQRKEESNPEHDEIRESMKNLFRQLDALSNFHFMPRPAQPDLKIVKNLPTIVAEEVIPATVSDATMLAPEEVKSKLKRDPIAKDERSKTDKNRERRLKKIHQRKKKKFEEEKERGKAERNPRSKERPERKQLKERNTALKSSTKFFERLSETCNANKNKKVQ